MLHIHKHTLHTCIHTSYIHAYTHTHVIHTYVGAYACLCMHMYASICRCLYLVVGLEYAKSWVQGTAW